MKIAIVGASGFVGRALVAHLLEESEHQLLALSRSELTVAHPQAAGRFSWFACDLHNLLQLEQGLQSADAAIYLIHSMLPGARLNQGSFADFDLSLADNFGRSARKHKLRRVVYLSGLIPDTRPLSQHLHSRLEVEETLRYYCPELICLRAGMIVGSEGSSFHVLYRLVERMPILLIPEWAQNPSQIIALDDVVWALARCVTDTELPFQTYDIGSEEALSYETMLRETATMLGKSPRLLRVRSVSVHLVRLWVRWLTRAPGELIYPLLDSLHCRMGVRPSHRFPVGSRSLKSFKEAVTQALSTLRTRPHTVPHAFAFKRHAHKLNTVRSIQRLPLPAGRTVNWVAEQYLEALPSVFPLFVKVLRSGAQIYLQLRLLSWNLLILDYSAERSSEDRQLFYVRGGLLARRGHQRGRLEFRETLCGRVCLAAVHDFEPALPWMIYRLTQAEIHRWFMQRLAAKLEAAQGGSSVSSAPPR